jgi:hypothetical protein
MRRMPQLRSFGSYHPYPLLIERWRNLPPRRLAWHLRRLLISEYRCRYVNGRSRYACRLRWRRLSVARHLAATGHPVDPLVFAHTIPHGTRWNGPGSGAVPTRLRWPGAFRLVPIQADGQKA